MPLLRFIARLSSRGRGLLLPAAFAALVASGSIVVTIPGSIGSSIPAVTNVSPSAGLIAGGTSVTITGSNFTGATAVNFGATAATGVSINSGGTQITCTSPAGTGTVDVTVVNGNGTSATGAADQFTYLTALPIISTQTFNYTGSPQTFSVPAGVTSVAVIAYGAQGGGGFSSGGGKGGAVSSTIPVTPLSTLNIYVGGQGGTSGGYNGGGAPGTSSGSGGGGGGASDIRSGGTAFSNRVVVAGGGGGTANSGGAGGAGGGGTGATGGTGGSGGGGTITGGVGGSQSAGGSGGVGTGAAVSGAAGSLGTGGAGNSTYAGGGGGGYYGGGGGGGTPSSTAEFSGGGGGSSFAESTATNVISTQGMGTGNGLIIIAWSTNPSVTVLGYPYSGAAQTFTVPASVTSLTAVVSGAQGGGTNAGTGGSISGTIAVTPSSSVGVYVGGAAPAGFNGGSTTAHGGGDASDIRLGGTALSNRVLVAGGGGGGSADSMAGGNGGGSTGAAGTSDSTLGYGGGGGGTQSAGGSAGTNSSSGSGAAGASGTGGAGQSSAGGDGGGGYYGGGGGGGGTTFSGPFPTQGGGGGGGGSSFSDSTTVTNATSTQGGNSGNGFVLLSYSVSTTPAVTNVSPSAGLIAGGTAVTLTGSNFTGATAVNFGATAATGVSINSGGTQITCTSPAGTGTVDVTVVNGNGTSATSAADQFTYLTALPIISTQTFNYTGSPQTFSVPAGVTSVAVIAYGAQGGGGFSSGGGKGGAVSSTIPVTPLSTLNIYVGGQGGTSGGYNGGGAPGTSSGSGGGGGGASDIRSGGTAFSNRVVVAGGGGGTANSGGAGGAGGGGTGATGGTGGSGGGGTITGGVGGSQSAGGSGGVGTGAAVSGAAGSLGTGGAGNSTYAGGGGGGYYGGGGGGGTPSSTAEFSGGGGGSSFTESTATNVISTQGIETGNGLVIIAWSTNPSYTVLGFPYSGAAQTFTVPASVTSLAAIVNGAQGAGTNAGTGGLMSGTIAVTPSATVGVYVGGAAPAGFNGGSTNTHGGGDASDLRLGGTALSNRVLVAGGGGGGSTDSMVGGNGGGLTGVAGASDSSLGYGGGGGGTQSAGGSAGTNSSSGSGAAGALGTGGAGQSSDGGDGGGGYYGGGGGGGGLTFSGPFPTQGGGGGGGGSSFAGSTTVSNVTSTQGGNTGNGLVLLAYSVSTSPAVTSVSPSAGPTAGGTSVTITGSNFTGATAVNFGATAATNVSINSGGTQITCSSPAGTGTVDITVVAGSGTSATGSTDQFTYVTAPAITSSLTASGTYGSAISTYTLTGSNSPASLSATGLPPGLSYSGGQITGTPTDATGSPYSVTLNATNAGGTGTATLVFTVNLAPLTITGVTASAKTYDRTAIATLSGTPRLNGAVNGDSLTLVTSSATGTFSDPNAGSGKTVTTSGFSVTGTASGNYLLTQPTATGSITAKALTVTGLAAGNKSYDRTTTASITGTGSLVGVISPDTVALTGSPTGAFAGPGVASGITVTISGLSLTGSSAANYTLTAPAGLTANITAKGLTVTGVTASGKAYDGGTAAAIGTSGAALNGVVAGDTVSLVTAGAAGSFASATAGVETVRITGLSLTGADAGNYLLTQPTASATIAQAIAGITLGGLSQAYTGSPLSASATTSPGGLAVTLSYAGSATGPVAPGSYQVEATISDPNYTGLAIAQLVVSPAGQTITIAPIGTVTVGLPVTLSATATSGLPVTLSVAGGNATLNGSTLTVQDGNVVTIQANQPGNADYNAAPTVTQTVSTIIRASQTITFNPLGNVSTTVGTVALSAAASSGLPVSFAVVSGPATVSGATLTLTGITGTVVIQATQAGNASFAAAPPVTQSFGAAAAKAQVYFGQFSGSGASASRTGLKPDAASSGLAAYLNPNGSGTLIGVLPGGTAGFVVGFTLTGSGGFTASTSELTGSDSAGPTITFTGTLSGSTLSGTVAPLGLSFSLAVDPTAGTSASIAGLYQSSSLQSANGATYSIVGTQNDVFVLALAPNTVAAAAGTVSGTSFSVQPSASVTVTGSVNPTTTAVTGTITTASGTTIYSGISAATAPTDRLVNLSTMGTVGTGQNVLVAGFVVGGSAPKPMLLRGVGPGLAPFGIAGILSSPVLTLYGGTGQILATNASWGGGSPLTALFSQIGAFPLAATSSDAAISITLSPGSYTLQIAGTANSTGQALIELYDATAELQNQYQQLLNISSRGRVSGGSQMLTGGFIVAGNAPKRVLVRGVGPGLGPFGITSPLSDPVLSVFDSKGNLLGTNRSWGTPVAVTSAQTVATAAEITAADAQVGAFPIPAGSKDAALIINLTPGAYTAQVSGSGTASGTALVEIYEIPSQ